MINVPRWLRAGLLAALALAAKGCLSTSGLGDACDDAVTCPGAEYCSAGYCVQASGATCDDSRCVCPNGTSLCGGA